jgi:hypothetical protein
MIPVIGISEHAAVFRRLTLPEYFGSMEREDQAHF